MFNSGPHDTCGFARRQSAAPTGRVRCILTSIRRQSFREYRRDFDFGKHGLRIEVVFPRLVNDSQHANTSGVAVWKGNVNFATLKRSWVVFIRDTHHISL